MNTTEMVAEIAEKTGYPKTQVRTVLDVFMQKTVDALASGDDVMIYGFGKFSTVRAAARKARILQTNEEIVLAAHNRVKFKAAPTVMDRVK